MLSERRRIELGERAHRVIPAGAHTYSKGDDQFPEEAPAFIERGEGCYAFDVQGNEFLDWGMGLRAVILGHAYPAGRGRGDRRRCATGSNFTRPSHDRGRVRRGSLLDLVPCAEMVKFAKNGSDATTAAVGSPAPPPAATSSRSRRPAVLLRRRLVHRHARRCTRASRTRSSALTAHVPLQRPRQRSRRCSTGTQARSPA